MKPPAILNHKWQKIKILNGTKFKRFKKKKFTESKFSKSIIYEKFVYPSSIVSQKFWGKVTKFIVPFSL